MPKVKKPGPNGRDLTLQSVPETIEREEGPALKADHPPGWIVRAEGWKDITSYAIVGAPGSEWSQ